MRLAEILQEQELNEYKKIDYILYKNKLKPVTREFEKVINNENRYNLLPKIALEYGLSPRLFQTYLIDNNIISSGLMGN